MYKRIISSILRSLGYQISKIQASSPTDLIQRAIDPNGVEVLYNPDFQQSCRDVMPYTLLDTSRLANLWQLCSMSNPQGNIIEIGSYRGGGALHLSRCMPKRKIYICDSFEGFEELDSHLDTNFSQRMFKDTSKSAVNSLFASNTNATIVEGFFPKSCENIDISPISFVHLDVDVYNATLESLIYLHDRMLPRSIMVLDDYYRKANGVNAAVGEFTAKYREWFAFPLFPGQGLLLHRSWFEG